MTNLFSSFDPRVRIIGFNIGLNWVSSLLPLFFIPQIYWIVKSQYLKTYEKIVMYLENELLAVFRRLRIPGNILVFLRFFLFFSNLIGLFPYIFTRTSHLSITLSISLPIWLGSILLSIIYRYNNIFAHLVPSGTPAGLIPIIVIIETVSRIIRPGTLAVRLAANIVAGHLLLTLLGSQGRILSQRYLIGLMVGLVLLIILELAVACIQSYVFTILRSLYLNELINTEFTKKIRYVKFNMSPLSHSGWIPLTLIWLSWGPLLNHWNSFMVSLRLYLPFPIRCTATAISHISMVTGCQAWGHSTGVTHLHHGTRSTVGYSIIYCIWNFFLFKIFLGFFS